MADLLAGTGSGGGTSKSNDKKGVSAKDIRSSNKQILTAVKRLNSNAEAQSAQQLGYANSGADFSEQEAARKKGKFNLGTTLLSAINRPGQAILRGIQAQQVGASIPEAAKRGFTDIGGEDINLRAALNTDNWQATRGAVNPEAERAAANDYAGKGQGGISELVGKYATGTLDTLGMAVLDPTTFLGTGLISKGGKGGQAGLKAIEKSLGKETADKLATKGLSALTKEQQAAARLAVRESDEAAAAELARAGGAAKLEHRLLGKEGQGITNLGELANAPGLSLAGKTIVPHNLTIGRGLGALGKTPVVGDPLTKVGQLAENLVRPQARVARDLGDEGLEGFREARAVADSAESRFNQQDVQTLKNAIGNARIEPAVLDRVETAMRAGTGEQLAKDLVKTHPVAAKLTRALLDIQDRAATRATEMGGEDLSRKAGVRTVLGEAPDVAKTVPGQTARVGDEVQQSLNLGEAAAPEAGKLGVGEDVQLPDWTYTIKGEQPEIRKEVTELFGKNLGQESLLAAFRELGDGDAVKAVLDSTSKQNRQIGRAVMWDTLSQQVVDGKPLAIRVKGNFSKVPEGYVRVKNDIMGDYFTPQSIAKEVQGAAKALDDEETIGRIAKTFTGANQVFKSLALNLPVLGTGTAVSNLMGNALNMVIRGGFSDPSVARPATKMTRLMDKVAKSGGDIADAAKDPSLSNWEQWALKNMIRDNTINSGFLNAELARGQIATTASQKAKNVIDVRKTDALLTRPQASFNNQVEQVSRMMLYMDHLKKYGSPAKARKHVADTLIDYSNLTKDERRIRNLAIPFYTFMSRNLAIQAHVFAQNPGKIQNAERFRDMIFDRSGEVDTEGMPVSDYAVEAGQKPFMTVGGVPILSTLRGGTPFQAATDTAQPLSDIASTLPGVPESQQTEAGWQGGLRGLLANVGGSVGGTGKYVASEATGTDLYTGAPITEEGRAKRALNVLVPQGRVQSLADDVQGSEKAATPEEEQARRVARIMSTLGIRSTALTGQEQQNERYRRIRELGASSKRQKIASASELKKQGKLASATKKKTTKKADGKG